MYSSTITAKVSWPAFLISFICSSCCSCKVYKHYSWTWWSTPWLSRVFLLKANPFVIIIKCPFTWRRAYFSFCLESNSERFFDSSSRVLSFSRSASKSFWKETDIYIWYICCTYGVHMFSSEVYLLSDWWRNICKDNIQREHSRNFCTVWYLMKIYFQKVSVVRVCNISRNWKNTWKCKYVYSIFWYYLS